MKNVSHEQKDQTQEFASGVDHRDVLPDLDHVKDHLQQEQEEKEVEAMLMESPKRN